MYTQYSPNSSYTAVSQGKRHTKQPSNVSLTHLRLQSRWESYIKWNRRKTHKIPGSETSLNYISNLSLGLFLTNYNCCHKSQNDNLRPTPSSYTTCLNNVGILKRDKKKVRVIFYSFPVILMSRFGHLNGHLSPRNAAYSLLKFYSCVHSVVHAEYYIYTQTGHMHWWKKWERDLSSFLPVTQWLWHSHRKLKVLDPCYFILNLLCLTSQHSTLSTTARVSHYPGFPLALPVRLSCHEKKVWDKKEGNRLEDVWLSVVAAHRSVWGMCFPAALPCSFYEWLVASGSASKGTNWTSVLSHWIMSPEVKPSSHEFWSTPFLGI